MDQRKVKRAVVQQMQSLAAAGVAQVKKTPAGKKGALPVSLREVPAENIPAVSPRHSSPEILPAAQAARPAKPARFENESALAVAPAADRLVAVPGDSLDIIRAEVVLCTQCAELCRTRTQTVFGVGNPHARLCFLGEAPGADEDQQGEPFVGRAGQLLNKIIEACKLKREEVYILNVLKCRPPGNRNPLPSEAAACRGFLDRQLSLIQPEFLCCLGSIAAQTLLNTDQSIGKLRGTFHAYRGIRVLCTYHPAYLLRNPSAKRQVWDDMKMLLPEMGIFLD